MLDVPATIVMKGARAWPRRDSRLRRQVVTYDNPNEPREALAGRLAVERGRRSSRRDHPTSSRLRKNRGQELIEDAGPLTCCSCRAGAADC
jgi:hypothetical protein